MQVEPTAAQIAAYRKPLQAVGLSSPVLSEALAAEPLAVLYFLRHFGCVHCRYLVEQLRKLREESPRFPPVIFVHQEGLEEGRAFFAKRFPGAPHIADEGRELYDLFGIRSMPAGAIFAPGMVVKTLGRLLRGQRNSVIPTSNPLTLSGMFLLRAGVPIWAHRARTAGDDEAAVQKLAALAGKPSPKPVAGSSSAAGSPEVAV